MRASIGFTITFLALAVSAITLGCSPDASVPKLKTPRASSTPAPSFTTLDTDTLLLERNTAYYLEITTSTSPFITINTYTPDSVIQMATYPLQEKDIASEYPGFALNDPSSPDWGTDYILYALNEQIKNWTQPYMAVRGILLLSSDQQTLALFICNESGGRGQFCYGDRLWLFDPTTGEVQMIASDASGLMHAGELQFSKDSQTISAQGCTSYANPYFGYCRSVARITWDVSTGNLVEHQVILITPFPS